MRIAGCKILKSGNLREINFSSHTHTTGVVFYIHINIQNTAWWWGHVTWCWNLHDLDLKLQRCTIAHSTIHTYLCHFPGASVSAVRLHRKDEGRVSCAANPPSLPDNSNRDQKTSFAMLMRESLRMLECWMLDAVCTETCVETPSTLAVCSHVYPHSSRFGSLFVKGSCWEQEHTARTAYYR